MVLFQDLWDDRDSITTAYFLQIRECESNRTNEIDAVVSIQRAYRGYFSRKYLQKLHRCATLIRAIWLGYRDRCRLVVRRRAQAVHQLESFHHLCATNIQRWYRGYHSRKYKQDYYARKKWVQQIAQKAELVQQDLAKYQIEAFHAEQATQEAQQAEQFEAATENLHHLVSTYSTPGVFKSVLGEQFDATAFEIPLEQHIKDSFKNHLIKTNVKLSTMKTVKPRFASSMAEPVFESTATIFPVGSSADPYASLPPPNVIPPQHKAGLTQSVSAKVHSMHTYSATPHALTTNKKSAGTTGKLSTGANLIPKHSRQKRVG